MSDFIAGFSSRLDDAARELALSYSAAEEGFSPRDIKARASGRPRPAASAPPAGAEGPVSFSPQPISARFRQPPREEEPAPVAAAQAEEETSDFEPGHFTDPIATARAAAYAEGFRDGREHAVLEQQRDETLLTSITDALKAAGRVDRDLVAGQLRQTVLFLVSKMVDEAGIAPDLLAGRIEAAIDLIADNAEAAVLRVNPEDLPLVRDKLPALVQPVGDAEVARGSFVLESPATIVEEGPALWLEQLAQAIDRVGVPPLC